MTPEERFDQLHTTYRGQVLGHARGLLASPEDAEDVSQIVWMRAWKHLDVIHGAAGGWLHRVTVNACMDVLRRAKYRETLARTVDLADAYALEAPGSVEESAQVREDIRAGLSVLDPERRVHLLYATLWRKEESGLSSTLKTRLYRARALVLQKLAEKGA